MFCNIITEDKVSYVSTGGRASLELLEGSYILYNITQKIKSVMLVLEVEPGSTSSTNITDFIISVILYKL
jgi:hypothetical protein